MSMIQPFDEYQVPSQLQDHNPWLVCEVAPSYILQTHKLVSHKIPIIFIHLETTTAMPKN